MKKTILSTALLTFLASTQFAIAQERDIPIPTNENQLPVIIDPDLRIVKLWQEVDRNNDNKISTQEFLRAAGVRQSSFSLRGKRSSLLTRKYTAIFAIQDLNKDGFLSKREVRTAIEEYDWRFD